MKIRLCHTITLLLLLLPLALYAQEEPVSTGFFNKVAAGGHDVKAYHGLARSDKAVKGKKDFVVEWKGAKWRFVSQQDSEAFAENPERFAPAYNGYCANALSLGEGLVKTNGKHWAIFDNKLFLFYASRGAERWRNSNYKALKKIADREWATILQAKVK
ncbi:YHS domain-containing (seleno)protein [Agarilytica rhodophyticola]|uniref:YHS domain-containing (seleno)protein n=1 Tax=Agarilytica rhodophyticola TaxID=1737490 RepID=UPI000B345C64|nr:YHS domain-containing (seleno)protein [Agarilytica rhodophyticola]